MIRSSDTIKRSFLSDVENYCKHSSWDLDTCLMLSFGEIPNAGAAVFPRKRSIKDSPEYNERKELLRSYIRDNRITHTIRYHGIFIAPVNFLDLLDLLNISYPLELKKFVTEYSKRRSYNELLEENQQLKSENEALKKTESLKKNPKRERSKDMIIFAMSKKHYKYDPKKDKNPAITNIKHTIEESGGKLGEDAIRSILKEAAKQCDDFTSD